MTNENQPRLSLERDRAILDFSKHLATLSSAALAFVAAFVSKSLSVDAGLVRLSIICLTLALLLSIVASGLSLQFFLERERRPGAENWQARMFVIALIMSGLLLTAGLLSCALASR